MASRSKQNASLLYRQHSGGAKSQQRPLDDPQLCLTSLSGEKNEEIWVCPRPWKDFHPLYLLLHSCPRGQWIRKTPGALCNSSSTELNGQRAMWVIHKNFTETISDLRQLSPCFIVFIYDVSDLSWSHDRPLLCCASVIWGPCFQANMQPEATQMSKSQHNDSFWLDLATVRLFAMPRASYQFYRIWCFILYKKCINGTRKMFRLSLVLGIAV